jgi:hypothetical protein
VKEQDVFWLGGQPGVHDHRQPDAAVLEPAIRGACRASGVEPDEFVAALGGHGSWLVTFSRSHARQRIVWNGRDRKLVLQAAIAAGGWNDLRECSISAADESGFLAGIAALLRKRVLPPA